MSTSRIDISVSGILKVALPVCVSPLVTFVLTLTDNVFASRLGMNAMNAVATVGLLYITFSILGVGLAGGAQILIARRNGEGDHRAVAITLMQAVSLSVLLSLILFLLLKFVTPLFFSSWIYSPEITALMTDFTDIRAWGVLFFVPTVVFNAFFVGIARTATVGIAMAIAAVANVLLCYVFVFGAFGSEPMGVSGAALATVISELLALVIVLGAAFSPRIDKEYGLRKMLGNFQPRTMLAILRISYPLMFQLMLSLSLWLVFFLLVAQLGEGQLQASHIIRNTYLLALISTMGFSQTTRTYVSTLMAEGRIGEIPGVQRRLIVFNLVGILLLTHGLVLYPETIAALFNASPEVTRMTADSMQVVFPAMVIFSVSSILLNVVEGSGNTLAGFFIEFGTSVFYFGFACLATLVFPQPVHIVWMADLVYFVCISLFSWLYLRTGRWKLKKI